MSFAIDISAESEGWTNVPDLEACVRRAAEAAMLDNEAPPSEISVVLSDDEHIRELNKHHRGMDKPTNVLSFPAARMKTPAGAPRILGRRRKNRSPSRIISRISSSMACCISSATTTKTKTRRR
jgi:probable rRNA maturation factor